MISISLAKVQAPRAAYETDGESLTAVGANVDLSVSAVSVEGATMTVSGTFFVTLSMANAETAVPAGLRCTLRISAPATASAE